jgi:hypothetical protein
MIPNYFKQLFAGFLLIPVMLYAAETPKASIDDVVSKFTKNAPAYLYSYFTENGSDGLHLMYSQDGLFWKALNNGEAILKPEVGTAKQMLAPSITRDKKGTFHMVWATGLTEKVLGYASSKDLINWSNQKEIPVMSKELLCKNVWAPEVFFDKSSKTFYLYWTSTLSGRFPVPTGVESGYNNKIYYTTTKDFVQFTKSELLLDPGFNALDPFIIKEGGLYYMLLQKEMDSPIVKDIRMFAAKKITGFKKAMTEPFTGNKLASAPTAIKIGRYTYIYWINKEANSHGAIRTKSLEDPVWEDVSGLLRMPRDVQQGTILRVEDGILTNLQNQFK